MNRFHESTEDTNSAWSVWGGITPKRTFRLGHKRGERFCWLEAIPGRQGHEQEHEHMKIQKAPEVSGPAQTLVGGDKAVILEGLYASDKWIAQFSRGASRPTLRR